MKIIKNIFWWIGYIILVPLASLSLFWGMITVKSRARKYLKNKKKYFFIQRFSYLNKMTRRLLYIKRIRIQTNGVFKIPNNTCLFIYNHKSNIDALVLIRQLYDYCTNVNPDFRFLFIAKKEIKDKKNFVTAILDLLDTLYIDRADIRQQVRVYDEQKKQIDQHCSILIAPEGTRNKDHAFGEFKPGSIRLAFDKMIPIQPIVLWGTSGSLFEKKVQKPSKKFYVSFLLYKKPFDFHSHNITWFIEEIRNEMENEYKRISVCVEQNKTVYKS